jgi:hypothetical protein
MLLSNISEPEDESMENAVRRRKSFRDHRPAVISVPSSVASVTRETSLERPMLSAREKGKGRADAATPARSEPQRPSKSSHRATEREGQRQRDWTAKDEEPTLISKDKGKAKEVVQEQSDAPRSTRVFNQQQQPSTSRQPAAGQPDEHQCDWKDKYDDLKAEVESGRQGQDSGVVEPGDDHQCDWKEKYLALKPEVEGQGGQGRQQDDIGLEGLTIVLHFKSRDDLVINTDLRELE